MRLFLQPLFNKLLRLEQLLIQPFLQFGQLLRLTESVENLRNSQNQGGPCLLSGRQQAFFLGRVFLAEGVGGGHAVNPWLQAVVAGHFAVGLDYISNSSIYSTQA